MAAPRIWTVYRRSTSDQLSDDSGRSNSDGEAVRALPMNPEIFQMTTLCDKNRIRGEPKTLKILIRRDPPV
jgi:hypothetical protein